MHKRLIAGFCALATLVAVFSAGSTHAVSKNSTRGLAKYEASERYALDGRGDKNGLLVYKRFAEDGSYAFARGTVTAVSDTSVSVSVKHHTDDGSATMVTTVYTFSIDQYTKIIRRFKGTATANEMNVGDKVSVWASDLTNGHARLIWDLSIWWMQVKGTIANLDTTNQTFQVILKTTQNRGITRTSVATIHVDSATTYKQGTTDKTFADLANGQTVTIRGSWNNPDDFILAKSVVMQ